MGPRSRLSARLALLVLLTAPLAGQALAQNVGQIAGIPIQGEKGVTRTMDDIMKAAAIEDAMGPHEPMLMPEHEGIERDGLPQNPASPRVASVPDQPVDEITGFNRNAAGVAPSSPQTIGLNFLTATLSGGTWNTGAFPPDTDGGVGPTQFIVCVNNRIVSFNKTTGVADAVINASTNTFFTSVRNGSGTSDPMIRYDRLSSRWFVSIINVSTPNRWLLAVSDAASNGTITGATVWTYYFFVPATTSPAISNGSTCLSDYPSLGVDNNALYMGVSEFCGTGQPFQQTDVFVIRKTSVLSGGPIVVTTFRALMTASGGYVGPYTARGIDNYDPSANEGYFISTDGASFGQFWLNRVANPGGSPTLSSNISITVPATSQALTVPHLGNTGGTNGQLDALDDRMFAAHIRNHQLWTAHNIKVDNTGVVNATDALNTRNGSRWYQFDVPVGAGTPTLVQMGTVFTATGNNLTTERHYWIPSIMVSGQGHAAMGFSIAGTNERVNAATVGRLATDPLGTMETPVVLTTSASAYNPVSDPGGTFGRRWGDYSITSLDPLDDMSMWTIQEYTSASNVYGCRVARLIAPPPAAPSTLADITAGSNPVNVTLTGTTASGSGFFDPGPDLSAPARPYTHLVATITNGGATGTPPTVVSATYVNPTTVNLVLNASSATANVASEKYTITITNPDGQTSNAAIVHVVAGTPTASIGAGPVQNEGNGGGTIFNFPVNLSSPAVGTVTVNYQTTDGSATTADNDYVPASSFITIPNGNSSGVIPITVNGDTRFEPNENFTVTLTGATGATLGSPTAAVATIQNDDPLPTVSLAAGPSANEGNAGPTVFNFTVNLSNASSSAVTVNYGTTNGSAMVVDNDYVPASGNLLIPANTTVATIPVTVNGDTKFETSETFDMTLSTPSGATLGTSLATATIQNDDAPPTVSIDNVTQAEGDAGTTAFNFTVSLSEASGQPASVHFQTADGSALIADNDYQPTSGDVNFTPGQTSQPVTVLVNGDVVSESDEAFLVNLSSPIGCQAGVVQGTGTIQNDDAEPLISIDDVSIAEGNSGTTSFTFTVSLSHPTTSNVTVNYQTGDSTATTGDNDYQPASNTLVIPGLSSSGPIVIQVVGDTCGEADEVFKVTLSSPVGASMGDGLGVGEVQNDDDATAPSVAVTYPNGGEVLAVGDSTTFTWNASDNVGVTGVDIRLSRDGGATYPEVLATDAPNTGSFDWIVTGPGSPTADCFIQVTAHDGGCNSAQDLSDAAFQITAEVASVPVAGAVREFALGTIKPNPTVRTAHIEFQLPRESHVTLSVMDIQGREIARVVDRDFAPGRYQASWDGYTSNGPAAMGVYFVHLEVGGKAFTKKLVLSR